MPETLGNRVAPARGRSGGQRRDARGGPEWRLLNSGHYNGHVRDQPADAYRELFERSSDAILIIEGETFVDCNQATVEMLRYASREQVLRTHPSELSPEVQPDGRQSFEKANEMIRIAFERGSHRFEWDHMRADGEVFPVEVLLTAVEEGGKRTLHVVWRDITERKRLEDRLRHALKMEAIGKLAGGIAHDFNNLLVPILANADLLALEHPQDEETLALVREISLAGKRAAELTRQLLAYSRRQVLEPKVVDLNEIVSEVQRMLRRLIREDVQLELRLAKEPCRVKADPGQLQQVLLNLASNARDAMGPGGLLMIETRRVDLDSETVGLNAELPPGPYALLEISDTGHGIAPDLISKIFDPFFTTKGVGRGTGLGLSTVYGIVSQSGGDVQVRSEVGHGTTFRILLPLTQEPRTQAAAPQQRASPPPAATAPQGGSERILVAEDEPGVAALIPRVLERNGYAVVLAHDGLEAAELYEQEGARFDLLLTDVIMPRLGGPALARKLRSDDPGLKLLFASGYTNEALTNRGDLEEGVDLLRKPFSARELLEKVRAVLDG